MDDQIDLSDNNIEIAIKSVRQFIESFKEEYSPYGDCDHGCYEFTIQDIDHAFVNWANNVKKLQLNIPVISKSLLQEAMYLLFISQPDHCPDWIKDIGNCNKPECKFCRIQRLIEELENCLERT